MLKQKLKKEVKELEARIVELEEENLSPKFDFSGCDDGWEIEH
jgi:hypothetical protein